MPNKTPRFTKQDFEWLADTIFDVVNSTSILGANIPFNNSERNALAVHFANRLRATNPQFNWHKFVARASS